MLSSLMGGGIDDDRESMSPLPPLMWFPYTPPAPAAPPPPPPSTEFIMAVPPLICECCCIKAAGLLCLGRLLTGKYLGSLRSGFGLRSQVSVRASLQRETSEYNVKKKKGRATYH